MPRVKRVLAFKFRVACAAVHAGPGRCRAWGSASSCCSVDSSSRAASGLNLWRRSRTGRVWSDAEEAWRRGATHSSSSASAALPGGADEAALVAMSSGGALSGAMSAGKEQEEFYLR